MGKMISLKADDGHELSAYEATPAGAPKDAVVVVQEIFGVNAHIRSIADRFAEAGYLALAPALFDRYEKGVELKYEGEDMQRAFALYGKLDPKTALLDVKSAYTELKKEADRGLAVVGFCYGGLMSWLSATTSGEDIAMRPDCAVGFYPGGIGNYAGDEVFCPVMLHIGLSDSHIGPEQIEAVRKAHADVEIYTYEGAEHGFNCDARASYNEGAAKQAWGRTMEFLATHIA